MKTRKWVVVVTGMLGLLLALFLNGCYICSNITVRIHANKNTIGPDWPCMVIFTVELNGTIHDGEFYINFGDGWTARNKSGYFRHEYKSTDKYGNPLPSYITVTITYVDEVCGSASDSLELKVLRKPANRAPIACFTWSPAQPILFDIVTLDASCAYDPDGDVITITWEIYNTDLGILVGRYTGTERIVYWQTGCEYRYGCYSNSSQSKKLENIPYIPCYAEQSAERPMGLEPEPNYIRYLVIATMSDPGGLTSVAKHYIDVRLPD